MIFLISFSLIYFIESNLELEIMKISEISTDNINEYVRIQTNIKKQKVTNTTTFFELTQNNENIKGIAFDKIEELSKMKEYEIIGKITIHKSELEIIISSIKKI